MPKLSELVAPPKPQTVEDMRNIAVMYTQLLGGKVIRREAV